MGKFSDGFYSELGTNSGKWLSNKLFGNSGWATPKRHIVQIEKGDDSFSGKNSHAARDGKKHSGPSETVFEKQQWKQQQMEFLAREQQRALDELTAAPWPSELESLCQVLDNLIIHLEADRWKEVTGNNLGRQRQSGLNALMDARLARLEQGILKLALLQAPEEMKNYYTKKYNRQKSRQRLHTFRLPLMIVGVFLIYGIIYLLMKF